MSLKSRQFASSVRRPWRGAVLASVLAGLCACGTAAAESARAGEARPQNAGEGRRCESARRRSAAESGRRGHGGTARRVRFRHGVAERLPQGPAGNVRAVHHHNRSRPRQRSCRADVRARRRSRHRRANAREESRGAVRIRCDFSGRAVGPGWSADPHHQGLRGPCGRVRRVCGRSRTARGSAGGDRAGTARVRSQAAAHCAGLLDRGTGDEHGDAGQPDRAVGVTDRSGRPARAAVCHRAERDRACARLHVPAQSRDDRGVPDLQPHGHG